MSHRSRLVAILRAASTVMLLEMWRRLILRQQRQVRISLVSPSHTLFNNSMKIASALKEYRDMLREIGAFAYIGVLSSVLATALVWHIVTNSDKYMPIAIEKASANPIYIAVAIIISFLLTAAYLVQRLFKSLLVKINEQNKHIQALEKRIDDLETQLWENGIRPKGVA